MTSNRVTAIVPLKAIGDSKSRMASRLTLEDRVLLLRRSFGRVAEALTGAAAVARVVVVVGDLEGREWARGFGFEALDEPAGRGGLNRAIQHADEHVGRGATLVVPADLPLVTAADLDGIWGQVTGDREVIVVPTDDGGTGALIRVPGGVIGPQFGPDSAAAHAALAKAHGVRCHTIWVPGLALDLDQPGDIAAAGGWSALTGGVASHPEPRTIPYGEDPTDAAGHHQEL